MDEPASHGYVTYRVRPRSDVGAGEVIHNTASIYFDFNVPVRTNDATTLIQGPITILPQTLLGFFGTRNSETVRLNWRVTQGRDIRGYEVERSSDGVTFTSVGSLIASAGTTDFSFTDNVSSFAGQSLVYRLKILGTDGHNIFSQVLRFASNENRKDLEVYPNPVRSAASVSLFATASESVTLQVVDAAGSVLKQWHYSAAVGRNTVPLVSLKGIPAGLYFVRVISTGETKTKTFTVL